MTDISTFVLRVAPVIAAVVTFLQTQEAQKVGDKATGILGATNVDLEKGHHAWEFLHIYLTTYKGSKAQEALAQVECYPYDEEYQQELVKEIARMASDDVSFAQDLKKLADQVQATQTGNVTIENLQSNYGAQGTFHAAVNFDQRRMKSDE